MELSGTSNITQQQVNLQRAQANDADLQLTENVKQQQTQSISPVATEQPVQKALQLNESLVNARVSEHQSMSSTKQITADEAIGSLIDVRV